MSVTPTQAQPIKESFSPGIAAWVALLVAGLPSFGGIYLALGEGKFPCPLCFYQRSFALATFAVLLVGLIGGMTSRISLATLALPLAFAGLGVALWHVYLESSGKLTCPSGILGISTAPMQSAAAFSLLCLLLLVESARQQLLPAIGAALLGLGIAYACWSSNPQPKRPIPQEEYEAEPRICLPPQVKGS